MIKSLRKRPRRTIWSRVKDFLQDNNSTLNFAVSLSSHIPAPMGTCGLRPDESLMAREPLSFFDMMADQSGWDIPTRIFIMQRIAKANRIQWLENQIIETLKTGSAPISIMTKAEKNWFLRELSIRKTIRESRIRKLASQKTTSRLLIPRRILVNENEESVAWSKNPKFRMVCPSSIGKTICPAGVIASLRRQFKS